MKIKFNEYNEFLSRCCLCVKSWEDEEEMISKTEISYFLRLFIRNGYVLDFSTNSFDIFTTSSIVSPCIF